MTCDQRDAQRRRDKRARAERLANWGESTELPTTLRAFKDAFEVRQRGEQLLKQIAQQDFENAGMRSRFNWIREGEHSNKLFFNSVKTSHSHLHIPNINYADTASTNHSQKCDLIRESFTETFAKRIPDPTALASVVQAVRDSGRGLSLKQHQLIEQALDFDRLDRKDAENEGAPCWLEKLISSLKLFKSPGPDGIPNEFYYLLKSNQNLLSLLKACFKFSMSSGLLPLTMRHTYYRL